MFGVMSKITHVFIDTNVFLSFFAYTNDDIEELKKLVGLIKNKKIRIYLTQQVCREFDRNREKKMLYALEDFKKIGLPGLPRLMAHYPNGNNYQKVVKDLKKLHNDLIVRVKKDALAEELPADKLFSALIAASGNIIADEDDLKMARERTERGDPPGKDDSFGDRLNWELLLAYVPAGQDIHIISKDGDFASSIDGRKPHPVLMKEWKYKKKSDLYLHTELGAFLSTHFPGIEVATDIEKVDAINRLKSSGSFEQTHTAVSKLTEFADLLTVAEIDDLVDAALDNSQIRWISTDDDVKVFFQKIVEQRLDTYTKERRAEVVKAFEIDEDK